MGRGIYRYKEMYSDNRQDIFEGLHECDINKTYKAVVEFMKFWNNPNSIIHTWSNVKYPYNPMPKGIIKPPLANVVKKEVK